MLYGWDFYQIWEYKVILELLLSHIECDVYFCGHKSSDYKHVEKRFYQHFWKFISM